MPGEPKFPKLEQPKKNIRELVNAKIPLEKTPAADVLAFQMERNFEQAKKENPRATLSFLASIVVSRLKDIGMYQRLSCQGMFGPKSFERLETYEDMKLRVPIIAANIKKAEDKIKADKTNIVQQQSGWFYVTRNKRGDTAYRIYLALNPENVGEIFWDIAKSVPRDLSFQMKTTDLNNVIELVRNDKIILYASEESADRLFATVRAVQARHQSAFRGRIFPPGGNPTEMNGVSVAREPEEINRRKSSGTQEMANKIDKRLSEHRGDYLKNQIKRYEKNPAEASNSLAGQSLYFSIEQITSSFRWYTGVRGSKDDQGFSDETRKRMNTAVAGVFYRTAIYSLTGGVKVSPEEMYGLFLGEVKKISMTHDQRSAFLKAKTIGDMLLYHHNFKTLMEQSLHQAEMALVLSEEIKKGRSVNDSFRTLLK